MSCEGVVRSFNDAKAWGFITHDGMDVFVHLKDCNGAKPVVGDNVTFDMDMEKAAENKRKALNVVGCTGVPDENGGKGDWGKGGGWDGGWGKGGWGKGGGKAGGKSGGAVAGTGSFTGSVKSFNDAKGWGFIVHPDGSEVFFHIRDCVDGNTPQAGDEVKFDTEESSTKPGTLKGTNVTGGTGWASGGGDPWGGWGKGKGICLAGYGPAWGKGGGGWGAGPYGKGKGDGWGGWGKGW